MKSSGVDSRHSWVVAFAGGFVFLVVAQPMRLGAQLFVDILDRYETTRKAASLPFSLAYCMRSLIGPVSGILGEFWGLQAVTLGGCVLCAVGIAGCFFAEDIVMIDIFLGIVYGIGFGSATALVPEIINQHFAKHRAKANGVVFGMNGFGAFVTPPLLDLVILSFGVSGTFLMMGGVVFNSVPAAMLLRKRNTSPGNSIKINSIENQNSAYNLVLDKFSNHTGPSPKNNSFAGEGHLNDIPTEKSSTFSVEIANKCHINLDWDTSSKSEKNTSKNTTLNETRTGILNQAFMQAEQPIKDIRKVGTELSVNDPSAQSINRSIIDVRSLSSLTTSCSRELQLQFDQTDIKSHSISGEKKKPSKCGSLDILWSPVFLLITYIQSSHFYITYTFWTITVDVVRDKGVERHLEVYFVMAMSLLDAIGRFVLGSVTDAGYLTTENFSCVYFAAIAASCLSLTWVMGSSATMVVICLIGFVSGGNTTSMPGLVTGFIEKEKRTMAMASRLILYAPMSFTMSPLIGYFRETLGSYNGLLYMMSGMALLCSFLLLLLPRLSKCKNCLNQN